jgi:hypothetical protein
MNAILIRRAFAAGCLAVGAGVAGAASAQAPREHAIPSCYEQLRTHAPRTPLADLTVVIDQTTAMDKRLQQIVAETVDRLIAPGTHVSVVTFSAFLQGRYLDVLMSGAVEPRIDGRPRDYVPKRQLQQSDQCLQEQLVFARRLVARSLGGAFSRSDPRLARSDILAALHDLGRRVGDPAADRRIVVVASDMLENSSITSFYQGGQLRRIEADAELKRIAAAGIRADFRGAKVLVIGAGVSPTGTAGGLAYRDPRAMLALEQFWRRWFAGANAELVEFGKPAPLVEIRWPAPEGNGLHPR